MLMDPFSILGAVSGIAGAAGRIFGANKDREVAEQNAQRNIDLQKEFAQSGIQWKVEDAKKAGLHPLAAIGAQTQSFSPIQVGSNMQEAMGGAGQDISRAMMATATASERSSAFNKSVQALSLTKMGLENQLLSAQIAKLSNNPPMPAQSGDWYPGLQGQGNAIVAPAGGTTADIINTERFKRQASDPAAVYQEPAPISERGFSNTVHGGYAPVMSKDVQERLEEDKFGTAMWNWRNRIMPYASATDAQYPPFPAPPSKHWVYTPDGQYKLMPGKPFFDRLRR